MIKQEKGVTLIALSIAVIIILTITGMIVYSAKDSIYIRNLTNMQNDIANLREKVSLYYSKYGQIPAETEYTNIGNLSAGQILGANDIGRFLIIELKLLDGLTLNYGKDYEKYKSGNANIDSLTDIYIINENSNNIFYVQGIKVKENDEIKMYYTDYTEPDNTKVSLKTLEQWHTEDEDGTTVITNGEIRLKIGDYVNYDPTNGGQITDDKTENGITYSYKSPQGTYHADQATAVADTSENMDKGNGYGDQYFSVNADTAGWRVLGIDEDTNEILLISADVVQTVDNNNFYLRGQTGYEWGIEELNDVCEIYGKGKGASGARTINVDDINQITGYNPEKTGNGKPYEEGEIDEYGNEVTYTKSGSTMIRVFENKKWKTLQDGESITMQSTYYYYYPETLTNSGSDSKIGISTSSKEYELLFSRTSEEQNYWLGSSCMRANSWIFGFGVRYVYNGYVDRASLCGSDGYPNFTCCGVRPIVSLKSDVSILGGAGIDRKF